MLYIAPALQCAPELVAGSSLPELEIKFVDIVIDFPAYLRCGRDFEGELRILLYERRTSMASDPRIAALRLRPLSVALKLLRPAWRVGLS